LLGVLAVDEVDVWWVDDFFFFLLDFDFLVSDVALLASAVLVASGALAGLAAAWAAAGAVLGAVAGAVVCAAAAIANVPATRAVRSLLIVASFVVGLGDRHNCVSSPLTHHNRGGLTSLVTRHAVVDGISYCFVYIFSVGEA